MRQLVHRRATLADVAALTQLIEASIIHLQRPFLTDAQIASSRAIMGLDTQLIEDGTYFVVEIDGAIAGCGGWSFRATKYGGDSAAGRSAEVLDPRTDAARIRAMYTDPGYVRLGVGRLILQLCEDAARAAGFARAELVATLAGVPLYQACGFLAGDRFEDQRGGTSVPLIRMSKSL